MPRSRTCGSECRAAHGAAERLLLSSLHGRRTGPETIESPISTRSEKSPFRHLRVLPMVVARREQLFPELPPRLLRCSLRTRCRCGGS